VELFNISPVLVPQFQSFFLRSVPFAKHDAAFQISVLAENLPFYASDFTLVEKLVAILIPLEIATG
jgi:hypothetical protein